jgi:hypothetical protein
MILLYINGYILLKVIPQGNLIIKDACRISRLKKSTSSRTLFQSPKPRCKSINVFTNILKIQYDYTKTLYILMRQYENAIIIVTVTLYFKAFLPGRISVHRHTRLGVTTPPVNV